MRFRLAVCAMAAVALLAACSSSPDAPPTYTPLAAVPTTANNCVGPTDGQSRLCAGWGDPGEIVVVVVGSSSCPSVATGASQSGPQQVSVTVEAQGGPSCTADAVETASAVRVPSGVDQAKPVSVRVGSLTVDVPARA